VTFKPDPEIFSSIEFKYKQIALRLRQHAYLNGAIRFNLINEYDPKKPFKYTFYFEGGLKSYIKFLNSHANPIHRNIFHSKKTLDNVEVEFAMQYTSDIQPNEYAFANNVLNIDGGTHVSGYRTAITKTINNYLYENGSEKEKEIKLTGEDVREGLTAVISVRVPDPQFEGQTKGKLNNSEVTQIVRKIVEDELKIFLAENPSDGKAILGKILISYKARNAAKAAREAIIRKGLLEGGGLPGKLADCSSKKPEESEVMIVEGDSAGGSAKQARDRNTQAVFPLRGKPINSEKYRLDKVLANSEMGDLVRALGTGIGENMDITKLRYHTIILMADADVDGAHINTLLLTLFYRYFREIIEKGHLFIAQPPLYKVIFSPTDSVWVKDDQELELILKSKKSNKTPLIQRFKGLGEMNPEQLWETTMNPKSRILKKVVIEDAEEANRMFEILMGEEVAPRKKFIETNSSNAELDL